MAIVISLHESVSRVTKLADENTTQKRINDAVRLGLIAGADWLIENNLRQRKFRPGNRATYGFKPRSQKYENYKRFARRIRDPETGLKIPPAKPAVDLVYTGRLRDFVESRPPDLYRKIPTATSNKTILRVPIQTPSGHRMQAWQYVELGMYSDSEYIAVRRILIAIVARELGLGGHSEEQLWRRAA
jgi:hypothetical protein